MAFSIVNQAFGRTTMTMETPRWSTNVHSSFQCRKLSGLGFFHIAICLREWWRIGPLSLVISSPAGRIWAPAQLLKHRSEVEHHGTRSQLWRCAGSPKVPILLMLRFDGCCMILLDFLLSVFFLRSWFKSSMAGF